MYWFELLFYANDFLFSNSTFQPFYIFVGIDGFLFYQSRINDIFISNNCIFVLFTISIIYLLQTLLKGFDYLLVLLLVGKKVCYKLIISTSRGHCYCVCWFQTLLTKYTKVPTIRISIYQFSGSSLLIQENITNCLTEPIQFGGTSVAIDQRFFAADYTKVLIAFCSSLAVKQKQSLNKLFYCFFKLFYFKMVLSNLCYWDAY